jgi:hypothetical protein
MHILSLLLSFLQEIEVLQHIALASLNQDQDEYTFTSRP